MKQKIAAKSIKTLIENDTEMTQGKLADYLGVKRQSVSKWLNGRADIPDKQYYRIMELFQVSPNEVTLPDEGDSDDKYLLIKQDLEEQLEFQNKIGKQYDDLLDHCIYLFKLKDTLQNDIDDNGIRLVLRKGNGHVSEEDNKSIDKLMKCSTQLMSVLAKLGLNEPSLDEGDDDDLLR